MNNNYRSNPNDYLRAIDRMVELIERDHGGCDDDQCSMRQMLDDVNSSCEEMIHWWACSGAADNEFIELYEKFETEIKEAL